MVLEETVLQQFFTELGKDIRCSAEEAGGAAAAPSQEKLEAAFTEAASRVMTETALLSSLPDLTPCRGRSGKVPCGVSASSVSEDGERLEVFVTIYEDSPQPRELPTEEVRRAAGRCMQFLEGCALGEFVEETPSGARASSLPSMIEARWQSFDQVKIWVLTNDIAENTRFKAIEVRERLVSLEVVDIARLSRISAEGERGDPVNFDFARELGDSLPCVFCQDDSASYDTALCLIPAEVLRTLYEKYDTRLLEANVRSFVSLRSKVNKTMYDTLRSRPEDFLAFNNGIVLVADQVQLDRTSVGTTGIRAIAGMKIVNGGQTCATIFFGKRQDRRIDISRIRIPAKIIILKRSGAAESDSFIADIARYANSQNSVSASDLSSSSPFHMRLESLSRNVVCPDGVTRWFYERIAGAYRTMIAKEGSPQARRRLREEIPPANRITKLELACIMNAWFGRPYLSCSSSQKSYALFMKSFDSRGGADSVVLNERAWKELAAVAIIYRLCLSIAKRSTQGESSVVAAYTTAFASKVLGARLRLRTVWDQQGVSRELFSQLATWSRDINGTLRLSALGKTVTVWGRDPECWNYVLGSLEAAVDEEVPELRGEVLPWGGSGVVSHARRRGDDRGTGRLL